MSQFWTASEVRQVIVGTEVVALGETNVRGVEAGASGRVCAIDSDGAPSGCFRVYIDWGDVQEAFSPRAFRDQLEIVEVPA